MKKILEVLNQMVKNGVIENYVIGGAIGVNFFTEPVDTIDLDIFIIPQITKGGIVYLEKIYEYLKNLGYKMEKQWWIIEGIPVDFVPIGAGLTVEAFNTAIERDVEGIKTRVIRPEYLLSIYLTTLRLKDYTKIDALINQVELDINLLTQILKKYNLYDNYLKIVGGPHT